MGLPCLHQAAVMSLEDEKSKGFDHHDVAIVWWKKYMFLGPKSAGTMDHSNLDMYLKALTHNDISGPTLLYLETRIGQLQ